MMSTLFFVFRLAAAWFAGLMFLVAGSAEFFRWQVDEVFVPIVLGIVAIVMLDATAHVRKVRLLTGRRDGEVLSNRQRREIVVPLRVDDAFDELDAAVRALPSVEQVMSVKDSLQIRARIGRIDPHDARRWNPLRWLGRSPSRLRAIVNPGPDDSCRLTLSCEPVTGVLADLWFIDDGANVENIEAVMRAMARRVSERRRGATVDLPVAA